MLMVRTAYVWVVSRLRGVGDAAQAWTCRGVRFGAGADGAWARHAVPLPLGRLMQIRDLNPNWPPSSPVVGGSLTICNCESQTICITRHWGGGVGGGLAPKVPWVDTGFLLAVEADGGEKLLEVLGRMNNIAAH